MHRLAALAAVLAVLLMGVACAQSSGPYVYAVDSINPQLPSTDRAVNLETPQASIETFLAAAQREDWVRAAQALELSYLPEAEQERLGPVLAEQLHLVIERAILLDWATLPDRPDARAVRTSGNDPVAGEERRSLRLALVTLPDRPVAIRLARLQIEGEDPVWVFPRQTTENIPDLYAHFAPGPIERALPSALRQQAFWTLSWWEVIALPLLLLAAFGLAALAYWAMSKAAAGVGEVALIPWIVRAVRTPAALLVFAAAFSVAQAVAFTFSNTVNSVIDPITTAAVVLAAAALVVSIMDAVIERVSNTEGSDPTQPDAEADRAYYTTLSAVRRFFLVLMLLVGTAFVLLQSNLDQTLGLSLLGSAGAIGLVLAFAAREALGNIMASLQIAFAKTARIGDAVIFEGELAYVEKIGFTHVRLRTWDDRRLMAPVLNFVGETFENWTKTDSSMSKYVLLTLDHRANVEALRHEWSRFVEGEEEVIELDEAKVQVVGHSRDGMEVRFLFKAPDPSTAWDIHCRGREAMLHAASRLDEGTEDRPAFLPREREVMVAKTA
ncbi:mechanosensitive ion channel family protein [Parvularcula maris]|uniref:Mechanosensitive ion channel family protein n=1 Tax=Parvularcula maris TaxID=2965077 RepID=A0A9X2L6V4_9PROT|nr:mechanosensitive ion channel domain-containing protein [Parvularcula maris]MCQ8184029.1 mechanosensitive ion channel family protein [Parvularcula maris]